MKEVSLNQQCIRYYSQCTFKYTVLISMVLISMTMTMNIKFDIGRLTKSKIGNMKTEAIEHAEWCYRNAMED